MSREAKARACVPRTGQWAAACGLALCSSALWLVVVICRQVNGMCLDGSIVVTFNTWHVVAFVTGSAVAIMLASQAWVRSATHRGVGEKRYATTALLLVVVAWLVSGTAWFYALHCM